MIELFDITKKYNVGKSNELTALSDINLKIEKGELIALMGRSGAGKSTLMHIIACLDTANSGRYIFDNVDVSKLSDVELSKIRNEKIGILLQNFALLQNLTALQNCIMPMYFNSTRFKSMKPRAYEALDKLGINALANQTVGTMSGGQKQRVALARAIVCNPSVIIADEPTGALDSMTANEIMNELANINKMFGTTIIIVTHDPKVSERCRKVLELNDGKIVATGFKKS